MEKIRIGVSSCLLGEKVRYDGGHKRDVYITETLGRYFEWVPVCPEVEYGLPVPREAMHLTGSADSPRLVTVRTGIDHTEGMQAWATKKLKELDGEDLYGFIFRSRSPSSGIGGVKIYTLEGMPYRTGSGIFGGAFVKYFPLTPVIDDGRLNDAKLRENFIERIFVYKRWKDTMYNRAGVSALVGFHTGHKLLVLSHSPKHLSALGRLVADAAQYPFSELLQRYIAILWDALKLLSTVKKNTNVLMHIAGYFKKQLSSDEKKELVEVIDNYHKGYVPLIVPMVLINHYVRKFDEPYLKKQLYLNPHPAELMLRNHV
jgi:uncharacterized protein YbgA (DUF1722 family)/uncharacterized protein YbbK (DUF523 family)